MRLIIEGTVRIQAPAERVFETLADPAAWFHLDPTLIEASPMTPLSVGATGTMRNRRGPGLAVSVSWTTTELVPGVRLTQLVRGSGYELTESLALQSDGDGTVLSVVDQLVPTSVVGRIMVALSRGIMERDMASRCARLRTMLEAESRASE